MSDDNVQIILFRLSHIEETLAAIHAEVKRTNGRVNALEIENAKWAGEARAKHMQRMILTTVLSGSLLAVVVWFVQSAIR